MGAKGLLREGRAGCSPPIEHMRISDLPLEWQQAKRSGIINGFKPSATPTLDVVACWFEAGVARNPVVTNDPNDSEALILLFDVLCYDEKGVSYWNTFQSWPLPINSREQAEPLLNAVGIL